MALEIQLFQAQEKIENGEKILQELRMELQVLAAPLWLCLGWNSLSPHWDLGLGLKQPAHNKPGAFPFSHSASQQG